MHTARKLLGAVAFCVALTLSPVDAAVRPPRLQYELMTLPNGLTIVLSPDHSTPIVHVEALVPRRVERREDRAAPASPICSST